MDALGFRSTAVFDAASRAIASVDALANRWSTTYDALGRAVAQEDPLGNRSTTVFDPRGLAVESIDALGYATTSVFDAARQAVAGIDPRGNRSTVQFDAAGRVEAQVSALGYRTTPTYDVASRQVETQDALGYRWTSVFNAADRAVAAVDPLGNRSTTVYDSLGRPEAAENALGRRNTTVYDSLGRVSATVDPCGCRTTQVYDSLGQRLAVLNANGARWSSSYDARGGETAATDPLGVPTTSVFDPTGNRTLRTDGRGWVTTYGFDALGRETTRLYRDGTRVTHGFDTAGRLTQMGDATGNTGYSWDAAGRQVAVQYPTGLNLTYGYDPASNRTTLQDKTGVTTYGYDSQNRVTGIENPYGERTTVVWDALNREQHKTLGNGMTVSHGYDPAGREWLIENRKASGEAVGVFTGTYDAVGNRLTVMELDGTRVTYGYDPSDQLVYEARDGAAGYFASYSYDGVGNRLQKLEAGGLTGYQYNIADELLLVTPPTGAPTTSTWDRMGNLETETTGSAVTTYTWDSENMLVRVLSPTEDEVYRYGGDLKRRSKESGGATTQFTWDGENLLLETDAALVAQAKYTDWPGYWGGLASQRRTDSNFYGFDLQWSTRVLVSIAGAVTDSYAFRAFGEEAAQSGATVNPFRYVGLFGYRLVFAPVYSIGQRTANVHCARFLSRDPISRNESGYPTSQSNPIRYADPSGLVKIIPVRHTFDLCGGRTCRWLFLLDRPAPCHGYVVQHVTQRTGAFTCDHTPFNDNGLHSFWEAWPIAKGRQIPVVNTGLIATDYSQCPSQPDAYGEVDSAGIVRFYCRSTTGVLKRANGQWITNNPGTRAGRLLSTTLQPSWWGRSPGDAGETEATRRGLSRWNCCTVPCGGMNPGLNITTCRP